MKQRFSKISINQKIQWIRIVPFQTLRFSCLTTLTYSAPPVPHTRPVLCVTEAIATPSWPPESAHGFPWCSVPFDEHAQRVRDALHELDDLGVGEVRTGAAVDGDHFIPLTQPRPRGFALASDLHGVERRQRLGPCDRKTRPPHL